MSHRERVRPNRNIKNLERRADHLAKRIAEAREKGTRALSYDVTELAALNWAIPLLIRLVQDRRLPFADMREDESSNSLF